MGTEIKVNDVQEESIRNITFIDYDSFALTGDCFG
jgi:hypothetical protein